MAHDFAFACDPRSAGEARRWIRAGMSAGLPRHPAVADLIEDAVIVVSELVTNAVLGGCTEGILRWSVDDSRLLHVAVTDDSPGWPQLIRAGSSEEHGRGLWIVTQLSVRFGVEPDGRGKRVWAKLGIDPEVTGLLAAAAG
jgi:anti-sigma regulatory factor (Ser/Thr protein kinase)